MRIVVVGGGLGGLASAARLAKTGHQVVLVEASPTLGGALGAVSEAGFTWDGAATTTLLPAALRDLFRKTGRPLERELGGELEPLEVAREHRFADRTSVVVPGGSRAAQVAAFDELAPGLGEAWVRHVDRYAPVWDVLRRHYVEAPWDPTDVPRDLAALLGSRETLHKRLRRDFRDERLALVAGHPAVAEGHDLRNVPSWVGVASYLEQCFGVWRVPGGMARVADLLATRMETRGVTVLTSTPARDLVVRDGRVAAVVVETGEIDVDAVVVAVDPAVCRPWPRSSSARCRRSRRSSPTSASRVTCPTSPPSWSSTRSRCSPCARAARRPRAARPGRCTAAAGSPRTCSTRWPATASTSATRSSHASTSPRDQVDRWGGSPMGVLWQGRGTVRHRLGPTTPIAGVYAAGAHAAPGAGVPFVAQSAALVAQVVGPA